MTSESALHDEVHDFRPSPLVKSAGIALGALSLFFTIAGISAIFAPPPPEEGPGVGVMMTLAGLFFVFLSVAPVFGRVRVDPTGVHYRDQLLRKRFMPRDQLLEITVARMTAWGGMRDTVVLVPRDGKPVELAILFAYRTGRGRVRLDATREAMTRQLAG